MKKAPSRGRYRRADRPGIARRRTRADAAQQSAILGARSEAGPGLRRGPRSPTVTITWTVRRMDAEPRLPRSTPTARTISEPGFSAKNWYVATVPGTVLTTLVDRGVYPDPDYGLNNLAIPESAEQAGLLVSQRVQDAVEPRAASASHSPSRASTTQPTVWLNGQAAGHNHRRLHSRQLRRHRHSQARARPMSWPSASRRRRIPAFRRSSRSRVAPARMAASCASTVQPSSRPKAGTGFPPSATATAASGSLSPSPQPTA